MQWINKWEFVSINYQTLAVDLNLTKPPSNTRPLEQPLSEYHFILLVFTTPSTNFYVGLDFYDETVKLAFWFFAIQFKGLLLQDKFRCTAARWRRSVPTKNKGE